MKFSQSIRRLTLLVFLAIVSPYLVAQEPKPKVLISPLTWADQQDLNNKVSYINELARTRLGTEIHSDKTDLETLQRIADARFIDKNDKEKLQATGVVLGNLLQEELDNLKWMVYEDADGRSRALCVPNTQNCLFPTTMISRRLEVDAPVDVQSIYDNAYALIKPHVDAAHPYQPSLLVRPEYKPPAEAPREPSQNVDVRFK